MISDQVWNDAIARLMQNYGKKMPEGFNQAAMRELLSPPHYFVDDDVFSRAVFLHMKASGWWPDAHDIIAQANGIKEETRHQETSRDVRALPPPSREAPPVKLPKEQWKETEEADVVSIGGLRHQLTDRGPVPILDTREQQRAYIKAKCAESTVFSRDWEQELGQSGPDMDTRRSKADEREKQSKDMMEDWDKLPQRRKDRVYALAMEIAEVLA